MNDTQQQNQSPVAPTQPAQPPAQPAPPSPKPVTPSSGETTKPKGGLPKSPYFYALLTFLVGIGAGYLLVSQFPGTKTAEEPVQKNQTKEPVTLPASVIDLKTCVDKKGNLFADPKALPHGPIFLVDQQKVVGVEYVLDQEEFTQGKIYEELAALTIQVNHMQVATLSASYDGKPGNYYSVNLFTVDKKTKDAIKCAAPIPTTEASPSAAISTSPEVSAQPSSIPSAAPSLILSPSAAIGQ